jgi:hypothetical protein
MHQVDKPPTGDTQQLWFRRTTSDEVIPESGFTITRLAQDDERYPDSFRMTITKTPAAISLHGMTARACAGDAVE